MLLHLLALGAVWTRGAVLRSGAIVAAAGIPGVAEAIPPIPASASQEAKVIDKIIYTPPTVKVPSTATAVALAQHLKATGATMYGAYWCSHCFGQKVHL